MASAKPAEKSPAPVFNNSAAPTPLVDISAPREVAEKRQNSESALPPLATQSSNDVTKPQDQIKQINDTVNQLNSSSNPTTLKDVTTNLREVDTKLAEATSPVTLTTKHYTVNDITESNNGELIVKITHNDKPTGGSKKRKQRRRNKQSNKQSKK
jgi:hypothetical protein